MGLSPSVVLVSFFVFFGGLYSIRLICMLRSAICKLLQKLSAYGLSGRRCSPEVGELRVAVRGMSFRSLERCYKFLSYPLRFARPPTLGGQLHPVCSHAAFANLNPRPFCSLAAFSYLQTKSVSLSLRAIRTALLP